MKKLGPLQKMIVFALAAIAVAAGLIFLFRFLIAGKLDAIFVLRKDTAAASRVVDVAVSIDKVLAGRENIVEEIDSLLPKLVEVNAATKTIETAVSFLFVERPEIRTGGVTATGSSESALAVQFTIRGRIREQNFDRVLDRLGSLPLLLDVHSATLDMKAIALPNQGEATYVGELFARDD